MSDQPPSDAGDSALKDKTFTYDDLRDMRRESAGYRRRAAEAQARVAELEAALSARDQAAREQLIRAELKTAALQAGMIDLDALKLIDPSSVRLDEHGDVIGVQALLTEAKQAKPYLFASTNTSSTAAPPPAQSPRARHARDMSPSEYQAAKAKFLRG
ncbi:phage scaffolding protein [Methylovirgula sp. 4M-Z18]|uniref:phage scaffolding protein n=1 Tax=Methylovirgula sp. 4M-Z18 TaxID=2293567 RepID=UPI0018F60328|nr:hypothetical protein [Methylovirgula sp. 4M-Z18]